MKNIEYDITSIYMTLNFFIGGFVFGFIIHNKGHLLLRELRAILKRR